MLDDEVVEHALRSIRPEVAQELRQLLAESGTRLGSAHKQRRVLDEFARFFHFARKFMSPSLQVHNPNRKAEGAGYDLTEDALQDLEEMNVCQITAALEEESPRTTAILMKEMSAARTAEILRLMQPEVRDAVILELTHNPVAPRILVHQVARTTVERAITLPPERTVEPDPVERVAEVLRAADRPERKAMLQRLLADDAETATRIQKLLYRFEDITNLDDVQIRSVLGKVETTSIATALFEADDVIVDKVLSNLSKRARETLQEELSFLSRVPEKQLKAAREVVSDAIAEVEMESE